MWNFHVWNDVWMERADLGPMFFGWQVIGINYITTAEKREPFLILLPHLYAQVVTSI